MNRLTNKPEAKTNSKAGFQLSLVTCKKSKILDLFDMPDIISPEAKIAPTANSINCSFTNEDVEIRFEFFEIKNPTIDKLRPITMVPTHKVE